MDEPTSNRWTTRNKPVSRDVIAKVEAAWQLRFPDEYVSLAMTSDGGHPERDAITLPSGDVRYVLDLATYESDSQQHIVRYWSAYFERLPSRVFPFADDGGGNPFAFDYRDSPHNPSIWWYDHEFVGDDGLFEGVQIASDFADFLNRLQNDDTYPDAGL